MAAVPRRRSPRGLGTRYLERNLVRHLMELFDYVSHCRWGATKEDVVRRFPHRYKNTPTHHSATLRQLQRDFENLLDLTPIIAIYPSASIVIYGLPDIEPRLGEKAITL